jgi:SAM-dependent methyltransferase
MTKTKNRPKRDGAKGKAKKSKKTPRFTAATADHHELYQLAVQSPAEDVEFLVDAYRKVNGRDPEHLREDFCGTGLLASHWIKRNAKCTAEGYDIDPDPVEWGKRRNFAPLGADAERMRFRMLDVREPSLVPPDVRCAHNFSYCIFKTRTELIGYLKSAFEDLAPDGVFSLDIHGGPESIEEMEEEREIEEGFDYVWDQDEYWPITAEAKCYIHFRFKDGSELRKAFTYDWRLWTLMELKEAMLEVGFRRVDCYWEGTDEDDESGDGIFEIDEKGENCLSWIAYVVGVK